MNRRTLLKRIGATLGLATVSGVLIPPAGEDPPTLPTGTPTVERGGTLRRGTENGIVGEAILPGQLVTGVGSATDKYMLYVADKGVLPTGIALSSAYDGQHIVIVKGGPISIKATAVYPCPPFNSHYHEVYS